MKYFCAGHEKDSGIYKIVNTHTNRIYVGQTKRFFRERWLEHKRHLHKQIHRTPFLQRDFNKCFKELGHDDFIEFHVLEVLPNNWTKLDRNPYEEKWIAEFDVGDRIYNTEKHPATGDKSCFSYTPEETKKKQSEASKKMWETPGYREKFIKTRKDQWNNEEFREKRLIQINEQNKTEEIRLKKSISMKKYYEDPEVLKNKSEFMKTVWSNETHRENRIETAKQKMIDDPMHAEEVRKNLRKGIEAGIKTFSGFILESPTEERFQDIRNLKQFAEKHGLGNASLHSFIKGKRKSLKGWTIYNLEGIDLNLEQKKIKPIYGFIDQCENKYENIVNVAKFGKEHGLDRRPLYSLIKGKIKSHKGWRLLPPEQSSDNPETSTTNPSSSSNQTSHNDNKE